MANPQQSNLSSDQQFAELEYMIQKYYNEHVAHVVDTTYKQYEHTRVSANNASVANSYQIEHSWSPSRISQSVEAQKTLDKRVNGMTLENMVTDIKHNLSRDASIVNDLQVLKDRYRELLIQRLGGQAAYDKLKNEKFGGQDIVDAYFHSRYRAMMVDQLIRNRIPKSSLDYIIGQGLMDSTVFSMMNQYDRNSPVEKQLQETIKASYKPTTLETVAKVSVSTVVDYLTFKGLGKMLKGASAGADAAVQSLSKSSGGSQLVYVASDGSSVATSGGESIAASIGSGSQAAVKGGKRKLVTSFCTMTGLEVAAQCLPENGLSSNDAVDKQFSFMFGEEKNDTIAKHRKAAKSLDPQSNQGVHAVNDSLDNKVKMKEYHVKFDEASCDKFLYDLRDAHQGNADLAMFNVEYAFKNAHIRYNADAPIPQWMMDKSEEELLQLSDNFAAYALEMQRCGSHSLTIGKGADTTYTMDQMAQRAYDYTHAAEVKRHERLAALSDEERLDGGLHPIAPVEPIPSDKKDKDAPYFNAVVRKFNYWISCGEDIEPPAPSPSAIIAESLSDNGFDGLNREGPVPEWMGDKTPEELLRSSATFYSFSRTMLSRGDKVINLNDKTFTLSEVSQRAYDYARAAEAAIEEKKALLQQRQEQQEQVQSQGQSAGNDLRQDGADEGSDLMGMMNTSQGQWGGLMDMLGLSGAGEMGRNLGYTLAMLPEMLLAMLTGKNDKLKLENNIFPLMAIFGGLFMKNPILKFLMIGLGGLNILNKGFGTFSGRDSEQAQQAVYKSYPPEPLNRRIVFDGVKDNCVFVKIDGQAWTVRISDNALDAYYSGSLSKEALCNRVLQDYDAFAKHSSESYERLDATQEHDQQRGLSMG